MGRYFWPVSQLHQLQTPAAPGCSKVTVTYFGVIYDMRRVNRQKRSSVAFSCYDVIFERALTQWQLAAPNCLQYGCCWLYRSRYRRPARFGINLVFAEGNRCSRFFNAPTEKSNCRLADDHRNRIRLADEFKPRYRRMYINLIKLIIERK